MISQCFSTATILLLRVHMLCSGWRHYYCVGRRGQLTERNYLVQNVNGVKTEKPCHRLKLQFPVVFFLELLKDSRTKHSPWLLTVDITTDPNLPIGVKSSLWYTLFVTMSTPPQFGAVSLQNRQWYNTGCHLVAVSNCSLFYSVKNSSLLIFGLHLKHH